MFLFIYLFIHMYIYIYIYICLLLCDLGILELAIPPQRVQFTNRESGCDVRGIYSSRVSASP